MKWVRSPFVFSGAKNRLLPFLQEHIVFDKNTQTWVEPFAGTMVVGLNFHPLHAIMNDINPDFINFWTILQNEGCDEILSWIQRFVDECKASGDVQNYYLTKRSQFNEMKKKNKSFSHEEIVYLSALIVFLGRMSFSQTIRYNSKGELNQAYSKFNYLLARKTDLPSIIKNAYEAITQSDFKFTCSDWRDVLQSLDASKQYFIYCDPPYVNTAQEYVKKGFVDDDLNDLYKTLLASNQSFAISGYVTDGHQQDVIEQFAPTKVIFKEKSYNINGPKKKRVLEYLVVDNKENHSHELFDWGGISLK